MKKKLQRRSADEIARDKRLKEATGAGIAKLINQRWEDILDASGPVTITLNLDHENATLAASVAFEKSVEIAAEFNLDDGQAELPGTTKAEVESGE